MTGEAAHETLLLGRGPVGFLATAALYGTPFALVSDYLSDWALDRGWAENLLRGALFGLIMTSAFWWTARRRLQKEKAAGRIPQAPSD